MTASTDTSATVSLEYPDPQAMIDEAHALGFRMALWHAPYPGEKTVHAKALHDHAVANGFYPPTNGLLVNNWGRPVDFTNPAAYAWWQGLIRKYTDMGIEGFKIDHGEDVLVGLWGVRNVWAFHDGSGERTMHRGYQWFLHKVYAETMPAGGGFILARNSTYGDQAHVNVIWPGDADSSFAKHREKVKLPDGSEYVSVGGLPATVVYGLSLGPSGFPFLGTDTGGYRHAAPPDRELFVRWFQQTALSSCMQVGNDSSSMPWDFEAKGKPLYDEESLGWYRDYARLHLRLFPYEWTYAVAISKDGRPIQRPVGLAYPEMGNHPSDEYLFGDSLLVAPVMVRGATSRDVAFPPGKWLSWWDGKTYDGDRTAKVEAPLPVLPLFAREGAVVPMLRPTIDTIAPTTRPAEVDSYATDPGVLWVRVFPGPRTDFTLFDGAVVGQAEGAAVGYKDGTEFRKGAIFEVVGQATKPSQVSDNDAPLAEVADLATLQSAASGWFHDGKALWIRVPAGDHAVVFGGNP